MVKLKQNWNVEYCARLHTLKQFRTAWYGHIQECRKTVDKRKVHSGYHQEGGKGEDQELDGGRAIIFLKIHMYICNLATRISTYDYFSFLLNYSFFQFRFVVLLPSLPPFYSLYFFILFVFSFSFLFVYSIYFLINTPYVSPVSSFLYILCFLS